MLTSVFTKATRDRMGGGLLGAISLAALVLFGLWAYQDVDISFYYDLPPAVLALMGIDPANFSVASMSFGAMYDFMGAFIVAGIAISIGAAAIAGEEQAGTFGLLLGNPLSRHRALAAKTGSMIFVLLVMALLLWAGAVGSAGLLDIDTAGVDLVAISIMLGLNGLFYGFLALAIGSWTGLRGRASGIAAGVMLIGYLGANLLPLADLEGWAQIFPWYYFSSSSPLNNGINWVDVGVLTGLSAICIVVAWIGIQRRDLRDKGAEATLADRLRENPLTQKLVDRIAGSARVSSLTVKTASESQGLLAVTAGIVFYMGLFIPILYNFIPDDFVEIFSTFPDAMIAMIGGVDMSTPAGFLTGEIFALTAPIAIIVLMSSMGSRALAGEEESHTMGLLLANPVSRSKVIQQKAIAMVLYAVAFALAVIIGCYLGVLVAGQSGMSFSGIAAASLQLALFGLVFGALALVMSAATGRRKVVTGVTTVVAVVTWFMFSFLSISETTEFLTNFSPWQWYLGGDPVLNGVDWSGVVLLVGTFVVLLAASIPLFKRRDLRG